MYLFSIEEADIKCMYTETTFESVTLHFNASSESNKRGIHNLCFYKCSNNLPRLCKLFRYKNDVYFLHGLTYGKGTLILNSHTFLTTKTLSNYVFVCLKMLLRCNKNKPQKFFFDRTLRFFFMIAKDKH